jgi:hypothetical protein
MSHYQRETTVNASPDAVFRLLSGSDSWPSLLPHVRALQSDTSAGILITLVWRWLPFSLRLAQRMDPRQRTVEQRFGGRSGTRASCRWRVEAGPLETAVLSLDATALRSFVPWGTWFTSLVMRDLCDQTITMIQLLAEADREAHETVR